MMQLRTVWIRAFTMALCLPALQQCLWVRTECTSTDAACQPALFLARAHGLNSARFSYTGADITGTNAQCSAGDMPTGIGPFTFNVNALADDVLITANTNLQMGTCNGQNDGELRLYVDGNKRHTFMNARCWGQLSALTTAFVIPLGWGTHSLELRWCVNLLNTPMIAGAYPTIITATGLQTSPWYDGRAGFILPSGSTSLPISGPFTPIVSGTNMSAAYTASRDVILWQNLSLAGLQGTGTNLRMDPLTTEDWTMGDDGAVSIGLYTLTNLTAGAVSTTTAYYGSAAGNSIFTKSTYDNTLNLLAFRTPPTSSYGKAVLSAGVSDSSGTLAPLLNVPVTNTAAARSLISFSANYAFNTGAGGACDFVLFVNGTQVAEAYLISSNSNQTMESSLVTIESIPSGTAVPVQIQYRRMVGSTCTVNRATLSVIPLE
ncbi:MAG: hypothetical protein HY042_12735 [Spirochaetia bacterium]|nr:hypothetical protein [Spirochaetia bacterium]